MESEMVKSPTIDLRTSFKEMDSGEADPEILEPTSTVQPELEGK